jgi:CheY-like chemotaxis protein
VLLDIMMPDLDGYEVCRRLRRDPRTCRAAIVMVTARAQQVDKQMAMRAGADAHVVKPFNGKELVQGVIELVAARSARAVLGVQVTVVRLKPQVGATTLAANLGTVLAEEKGRLAAALDLSDGARPLGPSLGLPYEASAQPWSGEEAPADWAAAHATRHACGLFVLNGLPAKALVPVEPGTGARVLEILRSWFDYTVVDTPLSLGPLAPVLLGSSSVVLLLLASETAAPRAAQVTAAAIHKHAGHPVPVWPVLAHGAGVERQDEIRHQVEQALGAPATVLPWTPDDCAQAALSQTSLVLSRPHSPLAEAIRSLAALVAGRANHTLEEARP